jgi:GntR family transcriptional regulator, transcriptional repressor for pyruvate dehydrogenase complex
MSSVSSAQPRPHLAMPPIRRNRSLSQDVVDTLSSQLRAGAWQPGDKLPTEAEMIAGLGVSRTVLREAISRLQATGLLETRHGIGTFVLAGRPGPGFVIQATEIATLVDVLEVLELRIGIESEAAALAATRRTPTHVRGLKKALAAFEINIRNEGDTAAPDFDFHALVAQASGNRRYSDLLHSLGNVLIPRARINSAALALEDRASYLARVHAEHERIAEAITARDSTVARGAMRAHLENSQSRLRRAHDAAVAGQAKRIKSH